MAQYWSIIMVISRLSPPIVVQAPASASENAIAQSLRDEHEFIAAFMKRDQENASGEDRAASAATQVASLAPPPLSLVDPPLPEPRPVSAKNGGEAHAKTRGQEKVRAAGGAGARA